MRIDAAGNLIGRIEGKNAALGVIAAGSHSDTVPSGGRFDGSRALRPASKSPALCATQRSHSITPWNLSIFLPKSRVIMAYPALAAAAWPARLRHDIDMTEPHGKSLPRRCAGSAAIRIVSRRRVAMTSRRFWNCTSSRASYWNRNRSMLVLSRRLSASATSRSRSKARPITPAPRRSRFGTMRWSPRPTLRHGAPHRRATGFSGLGLFRRNGGHFECPAGRRQCRARQMPAGHRRPHHQSGAAAKVCR